MNNFYNNQGFSLIEVLASMAIIATAVLGTASMQTRALQENNSVAVDAQAAYLGQELREIILSYEHTNYPGLFATIVPDDSHNCKNITCSQEQLAAYSMAIWEKRLNALFPVSTYALDYRTDTKSYTLKMLWDAQGSGTLPGVLECPTVAEKGKYCLDVYPNG
jgi:type IV pilus modification protein PilV